MWSACTTAGWPQFGCSSAVVMIHDRVVYARSHICWAVVDNGGRFVGVVLLAVHFVVAVAFVVRVVILCATSMDGIFWWTTQQQIHVQSHQKQPYQNRQQQAANPAAATKQRQHLGVISSSGQGGCCDIGGACQALAPPCTTGRAVG